MIDLYYWPTPNGHKITLFLEETGLPYTIHPIDIGKGEQFQPDFLKIAPNNRMPAIVDHEPKDGGAPISVFESGAILLYLAEKTGRFLPGAPRAKSSLTRSIGTSMRPTGSTACSIVSSRAATTSQASTLSPIWRPIPGSCPMSGRARTSTTSRT